MKCHSNNQRVINHPILNLSALSITYDLSGQNCKKIEETSNFGVIGGGIESSESQDKKIKIAFNLSFGNR